MLFDIVVFFDVSSVNWINLCVRVGEVWKVVIGILGKMGVVYMLDWEIGEFLWVILMVVQNVISEIDGGIGVVIVNGEIVFIVLG